MAGKRSHGDGTAPYRVADGRWRSELMVGTTATGRPRKKIVYGRTRAECAAKLRAAVAAHGAGVLVAGRSPRLIEWLDHWLDNIAAVKVEPRTLAGYRSYINTWVRGRPPAKVRLDKLGPEHLEQLYRPMREAGRSATTVAQLHAILRRALKVAVQRKVLAVSPAARMDAPRPGAFSPDLLTPDDARRLIERAGSEPGGVRWMVALALGMRQGEVLGLGWDDIDLRAGTLAVVRSAYRRSWSHGCGDRLPAGEWPCGRRGGDRCPQRTGGGVFTKAPKSEAGTRVVSLPPQLVDALAAHQLQQPPAGPWTSANGERVSLVFRRPNGGPVDARADWAAWKAFLERAGVDPVRLHDARHTAATTLLALGVDGRVVMDMLGWSQASMLQRYQHVLDEMRRDAAARVGGALWASPAEPDNPSGPDDNNVVSLAGARRRRRG